MIHGFTAAPALVLLLGVIHADAEGVSDRIVHDLHSGVAIGGRDPVAYFADGAVRLGTAENEWAFGGVYWRFANPGNRAAFAAAPEVYAPAYGGHDAVAVAEGRAAEGDPGLWAIHRGRLFLFRSAEDRARFAGDADATAARADAAWPALAERLAGP
jgi:hypothetical protein